MIVPAALCEGCGHVELVPEHPESWPSYRPGDADSREQRFCSQECLLTHLGSASHAPRHARLGINQREIDLLHLLARGLSNGEIARIEVQAEPTIKNRLGVIFRKLKAQDRVQAVLLAHAAGVLNLNVTAAELARARRLNVDTLRFGQLDPVVVPEAVDAAATNL